MRIRWTTCAVTSCQLRTAGRSPSGSSTTLAFPFHSGAKKPMNARVAVVRSQDVVATVHDERRVRLARLEDARDGVSYLRHRGRVERRLAIDRGEAGGLEQRVPIAERDVERLGERQHHLAARARAAGLDEAQVAARDAGLERERELTLAARSAPGA